MGEVNHQPASALSKRAHSRCTLVLPQKTGCASPTHDAQGHSLNIGQHLKKTKKTAQNGDLLVRTRPQLSRQ